jgi:hypothetical protein
VVDLDSLTLLKKIDYGARIYASPKLVTGRIAFGTTAGVYREIDPETFETKARIQLPDAITNAVVTSHEDQVVYVATYTNEVFCLERE